MQKKKRRKYLYSYMFAKTCKLEKNTIGNKHGNNYIWYFYEKKTIQGTRVASMKPYYSYLKFIIIFLIMTHVVVMHYVSDDHRHAAYLKFLFIYYENYIKEIENN